MCMLYQLTRRILRAYGRFDVEEKTKLIDSKPVLNQPDINWKLT